MTLQEIDKRMVELAKFAVPSKDYDKSKADEFYRMQKMYWESKNKATGNSPASGKKERKTFVNGFGEATTREITTQTYKNEQKRLSKEILNFIR